jgi:hypothetical protein
MGSPEAMLRATVNRLGARLGHGLADVAAELAVLAQDAPERIRQEWELFQEEVRAEAERLDHTSTDSSEVPYSQVQSPAGSTADSTPQPIIDRLRAKVAEISQQLEVRS